MLLPKMLKFSVFCLTIAMPLPKMLELNTFLSDNSKAARKLARGLALLLSDNRKADAGENA